MSHVIGDTFFPHHPDPIPDGDIFCNVRYPSGGDQWFDVVENNKQDISWDILNTVFQDIAWDILNDNQQDIAWDILNALTQAIAWDILNELAQDTSWHIHPAIIEFIQQFVLKYIQSEFDINDVTTGFVVCPIQTNFTVTEVIDDNVSMKQSDLTTSFRCVPVMYTFTMQNPIVSNFKITRILNNTRTP